MISYDDSCLTKLSAEKVGIQRQSSGVNSKVIHAGSLTILQNSRHHSQTPQIPVKAHSPVGYHFTALINQNKTLPCFGCNRYCKVSRTSADRWHISPTSQIANCMISSAKKPRAVVSKAVPSVSPERLPLSLSFSAACQQQVVGSAEALCSASLAKCTGLIALLNMHPLPLYKRELFMTHSSPPTKKKKKFAA